jgi:hypothetical protein
MMGLLGLGMLLGSVLTLILIGGLIIAMGKGESNKSSGNNNGSNVDDRNRGGMDRRAEESKIKEVMLLEHAKRLGVRLGG